MLKIGRADTGEDRGILHIPPCPSAPSDNVHGQGGHFIRFLENNANCNAWLASDCGLTTSESGTVQPKQKHVS